MSDPKTEPNDDKLNYNKYILIALALIPVVFFAGITIFDFTKTPDSLMNKLDAQKIAEGYDVVCQSENGMQLCIIVSKDTNSIRYNDVKLVVGQDEKPCLSIYLRTPTEITDLYDKWELENCHVALEFPNIDGWYFEEKSTIGNDNNTKTWFEATKVKQWWNEWWIEF